MPRLYQHGGCVGNILASWWILIQRERGSQTLPPVVSLSPRQELAGRDALESNLGCGQGSPEVGQQHLLHSWPWFFRCPSIESTLTPPRWRSDVGPRRHRGSASAESLEALKDVWMARARIIGSRRFGSESHQKANHELLFAFKHWKTSGVLKRASWKSSCRFGMMLLNSRPLTSGAFYVIWLCYGYPRHWLF